MHHGRRLEIKYDKEVIITILVDLSKAASVLVTADASKNTDIEVEQNTVVEEIEDSFVNEDKHTKTTQLYMLCDLN